MTQDESHTIFSAAFKAATMMRRVLILDAPFPMGHGNGSSLHFALACRMIGCGKMIIHLDKAHPTSVFSPHLPVPSPFVPSRPACRVWT